MQSSRTAGVASALQQRTRRAPLQSLRELPIDPAYPQFIDMHEERRQQRRFHLETEVWLGQDGVYARTTERLKDLSLGGAFIETQSTSQIGEIYNLRLALHADYISSTVVVRNVRQGEGMGVAFLDLSPEGRSKLEAFLDRAA